MVRRPSTPRWPSKASRSRRSAASAAPRSFPYDLDALAQYQAVVISDVGALTLLVTPDARAGRVGINRLDVLKAYVESGGGLMLAGGYMGFQGMFGTARFHDTAVEDVLPVRCFPCRDGLEVPEGLRPSICFLPIRSCPASINRWHRKVNREVGDFCDQGSCRRFPVIRSTTATVFPLRSSRMRCGCTTASRVRRDKAALFQWVQAPPGDRSSRKQPEQAWR